MSHFPLPQDKSAGQRGCRKVTLCKPITHFEGTGVRMGVYDDLIPWQEPSEELVALDSETKAAERAKQKAAEALMLATMEAAKVVFALMMDPEEDPQVRLRASEIIFSRTIPKVAAKHVEEVGETIDSADVASLRESIVEEIKRKMGTNG